MKRRIMLVLLVLFLVAGQGLADDTKGNKHDPNPTKDPNVQKGYDNHQKETKENRDKAKNKENNEKYTVHHTGEGQGGCPTSCGTPHN
jgi:hypothetical protein